MSKVALTIELDTESGNIQFRGPLDQTMLCFGLIEMARVSLTKSTIEGGANQKPNGGPRVWTPDGISLPGLGSA